MIRAMTGKRRGRKRKAWKAPCAVYIVLLILAAAAFWLLRTRGSVVVHAGENMEPGGEVVFFRQDDERWAKETLGASRYTLERSGCLVCCITSALVMSGRIDATPLTMNGFFSKEGVYDSEGNILWDNLRKAGNYGVEVFDRADEDLLSGCLREGKYPIVRVRVNTVGNFHYVLVTGERDGSFYCMDPLKDGEQSLSEYGDRIYAVRCVY